MAVTIKFLAKQIGVSPSVVSSVLNGKNYCRVSDQRRKEILALAKKLNCCPNSAAQALKSGRSRLIGILMPTPVISCYARMATYLQRKLQSRSRTALFSFWNSFEKGKISTAYENMLRHGVDGIITCDYHPEWIGEKIPVVVYGKQFPETDSITIDYAAAFSEALEYLVSLGHRRFGYIGCEGERLDACSAVMKQYGFSGSYCVYNGMGYPENGIRGVRHLLERENPPSAIFCHNDSVALAAMAEAQRMGCAVGSDLSIIGLDNTLESSFSYPALTTIDTFIAEKAGMMVDLLLARLEDPGKKTVSMVLKSKLIIRDSCGPVKSGEKK